MRLKQGFHLGIIKARPSFTYVCVDHVNCRVSDVFVELLASVESVEINNIPDDHDQVGEVEEDEKEHDSKEGVDLVVVMVVMVMVVVVMMLWPGGVFVYQKK